MEACVQLSFDPNAGANPCAFDAHATAYLNSYDPTNQGSDFLGDVGSSDTQPFSFPIPGNATFLVVVHSNFGIPAPACDFQLSLASVDCP